MKNRGKKHTDNNERTKLLILLLKHKSKKIYAAGILALATILMIAHAKKFDFNEQVDINDAIEQDDSMVLDNDIDNINNEDTNTENISDSNQDDSIYYTDWEYFHIKHENGKRIIESHHYSDYVFNVETGLDEATCLECGHVITKKHIYEDGNDAISDNSATSSTKNNNDKVDNTSNSSSTSATTNSSSTIASTNSNSYTDNNGIYDNTQTDINDNSSAGTNNNNNNNNNNNSNTGTTTVTPTHTHSWSSWQYYNADKEISTCSGCNETKYQSHSYGSYSYNTSSGLEESTCSSCGNVITRSHTHQFGSWSSDNDSTHSRTCTVNGDNTTETANHNYSLVSVSSSGDSYQCSDCGHTMTLPHSHTYSGTNTRILATDSACYQTYQVCSGCGEEIVIETKTSHNYGSPSTSESGGIIYEVYTCSDCGYSYQEAHEHTAVYADRTEDVGSDDVCYRVYMYCEYPGCTIHGEVLKEEVGHNWQHGSQTVFDTTIEYDECTRCHKRINEVETVNTGARLNLFDFDRFYDCIFDERLLAKQSNSEKTLKLKI